MTFFCTFNLNTEPSEVKYKLRVLVFTSVALLAAQNRKIKQKH